MGLNVGGDLFSLRFFFWIYDAQAVINVERDPQRLLRPTEGWKERQKDNGPSGAGPLLHIPHR